MIPAVVPKPAASLILMRDTANGPEVLVGRRAANIPAFPGATVFPGGKVERADRSWPGAEGDHLLACAHAAIRETFEETGILVCRGGEGAPEGVDVAAARATVEAYLTGFADLLHRWELEPDPSRLQLFSHWITPQGAPYRFDTWFFLAAASPAEAAADLVCAEFEALSWVTPSALLAARDARLIFVTRCNLELLAQSPTVADALAAARARGPYEGEPVYEPGAF